MDEIKAYLKGFAVILILSLFFAAIDWIVVVSDEPYANFIIVAIFTFVVWTLMSMGRKVFWFAAMLLGGWVPVFGFGAVVWIAGFLSVLLAEFMVGAVFVTSWFWLSLLMGPALFVTTYVVYEDIKTLEGGWRW